MRPLGITEPTARWRFANTTASDKVVFNLAAGDLGSQFHRVGPELTSTTFGTAHEAAFYQGAIMPDASSGAAPSAEVSIHGFHSTDNTSCDIWGVAKTS